MGEDSITITVREQRRAQILMRTLAGSITLKEATRVMDVSVRPARRLKASLTPRSWVPPSTASCPPLLWSDLCGLSPSSRERRHLDFAHPHALAHDVAIVGSEASRIVLFSRRRGSRRFRPLGGRGGKRTQIGR